MSGSPMETEAVHAAIDLVGRTGAKGLTVGFLHDDVPVEKADWYAFAQYRGQRITIEHQPGPARALEKLAERLLTGAKCVHCGRLVALSGRGAAFYPSGTLVDGTRWDERDVRRAGQCRWRRIGARWAMGCQSDSEAPVFDPTGTTTIAEQKRNQDHDQT